MFDLIDKATIGPNLTQYVIKAPRIAQARKPGQFVIVRAKEHSERIPLTVASTDTEAGTITLIVQTVGKSTLEMSRFQKGEAFCDVVGPMGMPSHLDKFGTVVVIGGGLGTAVVLPQAIALKELGNKIISIIGARTKNLLILQEQLGAVSDDLIMTTDDGSFGMKGLVTDALQKLIDDPALEIGAVYCAGPVIMMKFVSLLTKKYHIPTVVSLNPIMVDGTGMCGGCRVTINGETKFACVDGPEFDGHAVDYEELMDRLTTYKKYEQQSLEQFETEHQCKLG